MSFLLGRSAVLTRPSEKFGPASKLRLCAEIVAAAAADHPSFPDTVVDEQPALTTKNRLLAAVAHEAARQITIYTRTCVYFFFIYFAPDKPVVAIILRRTLENEVALYVRSFLRLRFPPS